jgi:hypothetical protein
LGHTFHMWDKRFVGKQMPEIIRPNGPICCF